MGPNRLHVVGDFSHRPHRRAGGFDGVTLLDRDGRGDAFDFVDFGFIHAVKKLPRIRGKGFDIAALAFRVERIESERRFARAAQSRDDDEPVFRQIEIEPFEIVVPNALKTDKLIFLRLRHLGVN